MQGCGTIKKVQAIDNPSILNFKKGTWQKAVEPLHEWPCKLYPDGGGSMGMSFATYLLDRYSDVEVGFIPCAVSGSAIASWQPEAELFENAVKTVKEALTKKDMVLAGILWHQGEADAVIKENAEVHLEKLKTMIQGFRKEFALLSLPFIMGELGEFLKNNSKTVHYKKINAALHAIHHQLPFTKLVSSHGLTDGDRYDNTHFDMHSLRIMGERYAEAYCRHIKDLKSLTPRSTITVKSLERIRNNKNGFQLKKSATKKQNASCCCSTCFQTPAQKNILYSRYAKINIRQGNNLHQKSF